jgi:hypothetical protein
LLSLVTHFKGSTFHHKRLSAYATKAASVPSGTDTRIPEHSLVPGAHAARGHDIEAVVALCRVDEGASLRMKDRPGCTSERRAPVAGDPLCSMAGTARRTPRTRRKRRRRVASRGWDIGASVRALPWLGITGTVGRTWRDETRVMHYLVGPRFTTSYSGVGPHHVPGRVFAHVLLGLGSATVGELPTRNGFALVGGGGFDLLGFLRIGVRLPAASPRCARSGRESAAAEPVPGHGGRRGAALLPGVPPERHRWHRSVEVGRARVRTDDDPELQHHPLGHRSLNRTRHGRDLTTGR